MKNNFKNLFTILSVVIALVILVGLTSIISFAEEDVTNLGIDSVSLSLDDSITVRLHTSAQDDDGSKVVVEYNGNKYDLTNSKNGVFFFAAVTPQKLNSEIKATMYSKDGEIIGDTVIFNTREYLEHLLELSYEESGCKTNVNYIAMRELAVNMLYPW